MALLYMALYKPGFIFCLYLGCNITLVKPSCLEIITTIVERAVKTLLNFKQIFSFTMMYSVILKI